MTPYYTKPNFTLYHGDSLSLMKQLPDNSVDLVFADPPYNLSNDGFTLHAGKRVSVNKGKWDKSQGAEMDFEFHRVWIKECYRLLKPGGTIWISGTYHSIYQCGFALQLEGYKILNDIAWFKPNASPNLSCRFFTASHETLIWARKGLKTKHYFNYQLMKNGNWEEDKLKKPGLQMRSVWIEDENNLENEFWSFYPPKKDEKVFGKHPTQKSLPLLKRIIEASTDKDFTILDPFTGSSTTGIACSMVGNRNYIGLDLDKEYLDLSIKRFESLGKVDVAFGKNKSIDTLRVNSALLSEISEAKKSSEKTQKSEKNQPSKQEFENELKELVSVNYRKK
jgi:site-specific DNA-methyltransferase (adenine-specific)